MLCWAISDMLPPKADAHMHMLHICHIYPVWLYVVPAVSYLFGLEVRIQSQQKNASAKTCVFLSYLSYCKHPSLTQYDGNYILLFVCCACVCVCVCLCVCVPLYAVLSHLLNIMVAPSGRGNKGVCLILYSNLLFLR